MWFRKSTQEKANSLGVTGSVWNNPDGTVGCIAQGNMEAVDKLSAWCRQGPELAQVEKVESHSIEEAQEFTNFSISR